MKKQKKILVLFEDGITQDESVLYSVELARRLGLQIEFLMLISAEPKQDEVEDFPTENLTDLIEKAQMEVSSEIRYGDKATELLKYMAANSNPAAIVWGSDGNMVGKIGTGKSHHWLNKLSNLLPCSIVAPVAKNRKEHRKPSEG